MIYGLIKENAVLLNEGLEPVTSLPATYFVIVKSENETHYAVSYLDLTGFVLKAGVEPVDYEPVTKYATAYFTANNDTHPANVREAPSSSAKVEAAVPTGQKAFLYGSVSGEALIAAVGSSWYYVKYTDGTSRLGYVYSAQGDIDRIPVNVIEKVTRTTTPANNGESGDGGNFDWIYIVALCVPAVIIMFVLFARPKAERPQSEQ